MDFETRTVGDVTVIRLDEDRLDAAQAVRFKEAMRAVFDKTSGRIILDLSEVGFMDSSGLGALVGVRKMLDGQDDLELVGLTPNVAKVFALTRMNKVFTIHDTLDDTLDQPLRIAG